LHSIRAFVQGHSDSRLQFLEHISIQHTLLNHCFLYLTDNESLNILFHHFQRYLAFYVLLFHKPMHIRGSNEPENALVGPYIEKTSTFVNAPIKSLSLVGQISCPLGLVGYWGICNIIERGEIGLVIGCLSLYHVLLPPFYR
jgi:hypothetical protein